MEATPGRITVRNLSGVGNAGRSITPTRAAASLGQSATRPEPATAITRDDLAHKIGGILDGSILRVVVHRRFSGADRRTRAV